MVVEVGVAHPYVFYVYLSEGNREAMEHLRKTIEEGVSLLELRGYLDGETFEKVRACSRGGRVYVWGSPAGVKAFYDKMEEGDYLFVIVGQRIRYVGRVCAKVVSKELSKFLWGGERWELIYFLRDLREADVGLDRLIDEVGGISRRGFSRIGDDKLRVVIERYGSVDRFVEVLIGEGVKEKEVLGVNEEGIRSILNELIVEEETIRKIVSALREGRHVILTGPPGTGKTTLAQMICDKVFGVVYEVWTADPSWTTWDILGSSVVTPSGDVKFIEGLLTRVIKESEERGEPIWVIIDEVNRTKVDEVFAGLLTDLERGVLKYERVVRNEETGELERRVEEVKIPDTFRIICTMNSFDVALLFDLGYAFKRRFEFFEVAPPHPDEDAYRGFERRERSFIIQKTGLREDLVDRLMAFMRVVRRYRLIGTAFPLDVAKLAKSWFEISGDAALEHAIVSKVFPQLEGLDVESLRAILEDARGIFGEDSVVVRRLERMVKGEGVTKVLFV